jgi:hypothetical protein
MQISADSTLAVYGAIRELYIRMHMIGYQEQQYWKPLKGQLSLKASI